MQNVIISGISKGLGKSLFQQLSGLDDVRVFAIGRHVLEAQKRIAAGTLEMDFNKFNSKEFIRFIEKIPQGVPAVFINNAGTIEPIGKVGVLEVQQIKQAANINYISPMLICNYLVGYFQRLKIINISTGAANYPIEGWAMYCSTKSAMKMFLDVLVEQEKDQGVVEVIHIDPGVMDTEMQSTIRSLNESDFPRLKEFQEYKTEGRLYSPEVVAATIIREHIVK